MTVVMEITGNISTDIEDTLVPSNAILYGQIILELSDTSNVSKIHVKLGDADGSNNLFAKIFDFDASGNFQDGTAYKRNAGVIYLGIGTFTGLNNFFAEAKLETTSGGFTQPIKFVK